MERREDLRRYRQNWQDEIDSAFQYRAMAEGESQESVARIYRSLAETEERHAAFWEERLRKAGSPVGARTPSWRARALAFMAKRLGAGVVLPTVAGREYADRNSYSGQAESRGTS